MVNGLQLPLDCPDPVLRPNAQGIARVAVNDAQAQLVVTFTVPLTPAQRVYAFDPRHYLLTGGERLFPHVVTATLFNPAGTPPDLVDRRVLLQLDGLGDFSIYTLTVSGPDVDPFFAGHRLRFRLACDDPFDCRPPAAPPAPTPELPVVIDYLAKDYSSFRQALLDFLPSRFPEWTEQSEADIGMMLLELLAATADNLSYVQDRVANEAYLGSATQRSSVARHLALIGYQLDQGASAATWLQFQVNDVVTLAGATRQTPGLRVSNLPARADETVYLFETLGGATLRPEHNAMPLYSWENLQCCLPRDSLSAALVGMFDRLEAGDYVLFDDGHGQRDVVRLAGPPEVVPADPVKARPGGPITVIRWSSATPLGHDFCAPDTVARANLVVATHGETITETLRQLTAEEQAAVRREVAGRQPWQRVPRQRLRLANAPLAYLDPATPALVGPPADAAAETVASILARTPRGISSLEIDIDGLPWQEATSLLDAGPDDPIFTVDVDEQGRATVVFGNDTFGRRPDETATVEATYRVGGGSAANLAADALVLPRPRPTEQFAWLNAVTNPLPATGGRDLESRDHARRFGPATFKQPLVAVTVADYQAAALSLPAPGSQPPIQRANADFHWTGSWLTVTLAVDPAGSEGLTDPLRRSLLTYLDGRRLAGYDLDVRRALYVPVDLAVEFCVAPDHRAADVQQGLELALSNRVLTGDARGFFHPDNFSFGDPVYVSRLYQATMAVPGVESAQITRLARLWAAHPDVETATNLRQGYLGVAVDEIARLDNDRNLPQNGTLAIGPKGGG
ncbi:MAG TPA: hypothetical protein VMU89_23830 [Thermomicrobiaceae bacterium]|nr:hypothetical protein [Thermomicrobiaceae bacterium]